MNQRNENREERNEDGRKEGLDDVFFPRVARKIIVLHGVQYRKYLRRIIQTKLGQNVEML